MSWEPLGVKASIIEINADGYLVINGAVTDLKIMIQHTHTYGEWTSVSLPTCTENGEEARFCTVQNCTQKETRAVRKLGHSWKDATCTLAKTCSTCGGTEGEALGHSWQAATCTLAQTCVVCGEIYGDPLGHDWTDFITDNGKHCERIGCGIFEGAMVYYENFDSLDESYDMAQILTALGWKLPVGKQGVGFANTTVRAELTDNLASIDGVDLTPFALEGWLSRPNFVALSSQDGRLYIDNVTYNPTTAFDTEKTGTFFDGALLVRDGEYMENCFGGNYTVQVDIEFCEKLDAGNGNIAFAPYFGNDGQGGSHTRLMYQISPDGNLHERVQLSGTYTQYSGARSIVSAVFGEVATDFYSKKLTLRMVVVNAPSASDYGVNVYVRAEGESEFVLVSSMADAGYETLVSKYTTLKNGEYSNFAIFCGEGGRFYIDDLAIWTGTGEMPTDTTTKAYEDAMADSGTMIYYEDFEGITATGNVGILAALGWKDSANYDNAGGNSTHKTDGGGAVLQESWKNTGLTTNKSLLSIDNGRLKIDNESENTNGAWATFQLVDDSYMENALKDNFTVQYDITFDEENENPYMWAGVGATSGVSGNRAALNTSSARVYSMGFVQSLVTYNNLVQWQSEAGGSDTDRRILEKVFGTLSDTSETLVGKTVTVKVVYVVTDGGELARGMHTYIKHGNGDFVLVDSSAQEGSYYLYDSLKKTLVFMMGGYYTQSGTVRIDGTNGNPSLEAWGHNTTNREAFSKDGITYEPYYTEEFDASGVIYLDNFAVWVGTGEMPAHDRTNLKYVNG